MISPNSPRTELKISITRILTNLITLMLVHPPCFTIESDVPYKLGSEASANAALLPLIPTETPHTRLHIPTVIPAQNNA